MTYSPLRHAGALLRKSRPIQLTFFLTRRCNARCSFCFYLSRREVRQCRAPELAPAEIERMASSLGSLLWLALSGGEPFLRQDLVEVVNIFYRHNRPAIILLPTNGLLPEIIAARTAAILADCPKSVVVVKLSLDGPEAVHDSLRGTHGAFRNVLSTGRLLADLARKHDNLELGVNTVFCRANQDVMEDTIRLVGQLEWAWTHTISLVRGEADDRSLQEVDRERYRQVINLLENDLKRHRTRGYRFRGSRLKSAQDIVQRRLIHQVGMQGRQVIPCHAGRLTLVVTESGDVYPCESFTGRLGNVRQEGYDLRKIATGRRATRAVASIRAGRCHCTHECYMMMNILFNLRMYASIGREYLGLGKRPLRDRTRNRA